MQRREIRRRRHHGFPDFASLHPGYGVLFRELLLDKRRHEPRHRRGEIAGIVHQMHRGKFGLIMAGEIGLYPGAHLVDRHLDIQHAEHRNRSAGDDAIPMRAGPIIGRRQAGFLLDLARDAACYIDRAAAEVVEVGRARRKIDAPGIRGMLAHFAQYERAVGAAQCAHSEAVEHAPVRKAPVAPCQEACEIGVEIAGAEAVASENWIACQQNPPIPDFRFLALLDREMRLDLSAPLVGERPRPRSDVQIKRGDAMNRDWRHRPPPAYIWPAAALFTKRSSNVRFRSILAPFISGPNSSKRFTPSFIPSGAMMPVLEYIGFEALNAARYSALSPRKYSSGTVLTISSGVAFSSHLIAL